MTIERIAIDFDGYKDRGNKTAQLTTDGKVPDFEVVAPWLVAQLKVNLRPLWGPAITAMGVLLKSHSVKGWELVFGELKKTSEGAMDLDGLGVVAPPWGEAFEHEEDEGEPFEVEKSWNDPERRNLSMTVLKFDDLAGQTKRREMMQVRLTGFL